MCLFLSRNVQQRAVLSKHVAGQTLESIISRVHLSINTWFGSTIFEMEQKMNEDINLKENDPIQIHTHAHTHRVRLILTWSQTLR